MEEEEDAAPDIDDPQVQAAALLPKRRTLPKAEAILAHYILFYRRLYDLYAFQQAKTRLLSRTPQLLLSTTPQSRFRPLSCYQHHRPAVFRAGRQCSRRVSATLRAGLGADSPKLRILQRRNPPQSCCRYPGKIQRRFQCKARQFRSVCSSAGRRASMMMPGDDAAVGSSSEQRPKPAGAAAREQVASSSWWCGLRKRVLIEWMAVTNGRCIGSAPLFDVDAGAFAPSDKTVKTPDQEYYVKPKCNYERKTFVLYVYFGHEDLTDCRAYFPLVYQKRPKSPSTIVSFFGKSYCTKTTHLCNIHPSIMGRKIVVVERLLAVVGLVTILRSSFFTTNLEGYSSATDELLSAGASLFSSIEAESTSTHGGASRALRRSTVQSEEEERKKEREKPKLWPQFDNTISNAIIHGIHIEANATLMNQTGYDAPVPGLATIVTAMYSMPSKHPTNQYEDWFKLMLCATDPMVIFVDPNSPWVDFVLQRRQHAPTIIALLEFEKFTMATTFNESFWQEVLPQDQTKRSARVQRSTKYGTKRSS